jgi:hypothetical protein
VHFTLSNWNLNRRCSLRHWRRIISLMHIIIHLRVAGRQPIAVGGRRLW